MSIEVFKTNVQTADQAIWVAERIHNLCRSYQANFDLDDCDKILRIKNVVDEEVNAADIIRVMNCAGFFAEVLDDEIPENPFPSLSLLKFSANLFALN